MIYLEPGRTLPVFYSFYPAIGWFIAALGDMTEIQKRLLQIIKDNDLPQSKNVAYRNVRFDIIHNYTPDLKQSSIKEELMNLLGANLIGTSQGLIEIPVRYFE